MWVEKDALSRFFEDAVWKYCCRIVVTRGQVYATFIKEYARRAEAAIRRGQDPVILYFGDLDPTGMQIHHSIQKKLAERHNLFIEVDRIALWPHQVDFYNLPSEPKATKKTDPNYKKYCANGYGDLSVELDALDPKDLIGLIDHALRQNLDVADMIEQQNIQEKERQTLKKLEMSFVDLCHEHGLRI